MEQISQIVTLIGGAIATILLPLLGAFMFYDSKKRREAAQAEKAEADNISQYAAEWKELYEKKEAKVHELDTKIDQLYVEKNEDGLNTQAVSDRPKTQSWNLRIRL